MTKKDFNKLDVEKLNKVVKGNKKRSTNLEIYSNEKYVFVIAIGTNSNKEWVNNIFGGLAPFDSIVLSQNGEWIADRIQELLEKHTGKEFFFLGHSRGGAEMQSACEQLLERKIEVIHSNIYSFDGSRFFKLIKNKRQIKVIDCTKLIYRKKAIVHKQPFFASKQARKVNTKVLPKIGGIVENHLFSPKQMIEQVIEWEKIKLWK